MNQLHVDDNASVHVAQYEWGWLVSAYTAARYCTVSLHRIQPPAMTTQKPDPHQMYNDPHHC